MSNYISIWYIIGNREYVLPNLELKVLDKRFGSDGKVNAASNVRRRGDQLSAQRGSKLNRIQLVE